MANVTACLPIAISRALAPQLEQAGFDVTFVAFDGGHELPDEILKQALDLWLGG